MRVLAIDPGYDRLGVAVVEKINNKDVLVFSDCITTPKERVPAERLVLLGDRLNEIVTSYKPDVLAIETLFFSKNQKTVMLVAAARGVVLYCAKKAGLRIAEYSPLQVKVAITGYGKSDKTQVTYMVKQLVEVEKEIAYDDEFDAIAIGLTCLAIEK